MKNEMFLQHSDFIFLSPSLIMKKSLKCISMLHYKYRWSLLKVQNRLCAYPCSETKDKGRKGEERKKEEEKGGGQEISNLHEKLWHILNIFVCQNNIFNLNM